MSNASRVRLGEPRGSVVQIARTFWNSKSMTDNAIHCHKDWRRTYEDLAGICTKSFTCLTPYARLQGLSTTFCITGIAVLLAGFQPNVHQTCCLSFHYLAVMPSSCTRCCALDDKPVLLALLSMTEIY